MERLFTSESVTAGHPDKVCDQISDAILDACLSQDSDSRVACETAINTDFVLVMGKITTKAIIDIPSIVRKTVQEIGYETAEDGFDLQNAEIKVSIKQQSSDISQGVNRSEYIGAGDQGMMFGYATDETEEYMPLAVVLAHRLAKRLEIIRKEGNLSYLRPDGKSQVTVEYGEDGYPVRVDTIVVSAQHDETVTHEQIEKDIIEEVIKKCIPEKYLDTDTKFLINPTGRFVIGGPYSDSGLTGRKIIVDSYGGLARHGGGAFSGKDYTKVDRSAAYAARYVAKNIVGAGLAKQCEIQLAYAIGVAEPVSIRIETFGTSCISDEELAEIVEREFSLSPSGIIEMLKLKQPIYHRTSVYGHFGNDLKLPWEQMDRVEKLKKYRK
ncbi:MULTISPECIES: methionine adenosyltransferase [Lachnospiraceae]|jgi:S-adenosylmethionine synthetase|uniref:S-adenosylmethionine synthase n=1 Tax=Coprococcus comes TaxID=410072 RepID=A0A3E4GTJ9_9FIRM|nr:MULTISPECIES: methionine adenosyltransferase [Lachnospiraceae]RHP73814.1 methionine adenosyltransferase [Ruminococcus sp. OF02-6]RHU06487.1 methionine adenosyltransferase [Ruminococcus sp. AM27-16]RJW22323.1 methionine adenosyltransferase [Lachnospiraceae bacterium TM07-2AC]MDB8698985.1 methionine adenosyltransferase [Mediterraneibacter gnavus]RGJ26273.1 methionine adenosyltransferase [Coprococcus comes]